MIPYAENVVNSQIVNMYNNMLSTLLEVERPLLQAKLDDIDKVLQKGLKHLNWKSNAIQEFVANTMAKVKEANSILQTIKSNVKETQIVLKSFAEPLMMDRNATKTYTTDQFQEIFKRTVSTRYTAITKGGLAIHEQLSNSNKVLKVTKGNENWRRYVDYVNQIVVEGMCEVALASARYLKNQLDDVFLNVNEVSPLLEIQLKLAPPLAMFTPQMGNTQKKDGLRDMIDSWLSSFTNISTLVSRLDTSEEDGDYLLDMQEDVSVRYIVSQIYKAIAQNEAKCEEFRQQFMAYSYIWLEDIQQKFASWKEANSNKDPDAIDKDPPLSAFDNQIIRYKALEEEIRDLPQIKIIGWVKIDAKPIKSALSSWVSKWTYQYQSYLLDKVTSKVTDLVQFVSFTDTALDTEVSDTDRKAMLDVMGYLRDVRKRADGTDAMFDPLRQTVSLLSKHLVQTPDEVLRQLEEAPLTWNNLKKKAVVTKEKQAKNHSREADKIKKESKEFEAKVEAFCTAFKKEMPFEYQSNYNEAYKQLDSIHHGPNNVMMLCGEGSTPTQMGTLKQMRKEVLNLNELQELFELYVIEYREVAQCEKDAVMLKRVWDVISMVQAIYTDWRSTKWDEIYVEVLQEENKKLQKEVKGCDKMVKNWPCFKGLEDAVKNMQTSLPLVEDLHHPAMRERHWNQLMRACGVQFKMDEKFTFGDMLKLELHRFEDDVLEIVDRAQKELTIEKQLQKLVDTWRIQNLSYPPDPENADLVLLAVDETVMEALEDNTLQLQNLMASKYVQGNADFLEKVLTWQKKLGMVDVVISTWKEVQSKWSNLQSIFIGSADIRVQLPEDSKRFDGVDAEWKELMKEAVNETNAVTACNFEGRQERLDNMLGNLEKCEKSLADYLETKRVAFPRFYFVASADLLDILSKGSNPQLIIKHLQKFFDNIKTLEFNKDSNSVPTKTAIGMYSGENEYVAWPTTFVCEGAVETWLFKLTEHTHDSLKALMQDAHKAFDEKPRHEFIFDWCAELVSVVARIVYTEEVNWSFEQLEEGNENALRDFNKKQIDILNKYAELILGDLTSNDRRKIIMLMTLDVHARDVVIGLIDTKAESKEAFAWMSQLKYHMDDKTNTVRIEICDYVTYFGYEYIGNCGCLVVTPLTDRCYITLTQAMRLILGGAPAGPAGT